MIKKIIIYFLILCFTFPITFSIVGCKNRTENLENLESNENLEDLESNENLENGVTHNKGFYKNASIKNFETYKYFGISEKSNNNVVLYASESNNDDNNESIDINADLIGITESGESKKIEIESEQFIFKEKDSYLQKFENYKRFSFAIYSFEQNKYVDNTWGKTIHESIYYYDKIGYTTNICIKSRCLNSYGAGYDVENTYNNSDFLIIDNNNGKIYDLWDIINSIPGAKQIRILNDSLYLDTIFFIVEKTNGYFNDQTTYDSELYQLEFLENDINLKKRINSGKLNSIYNSYENTDSTRHNYGFLKFDICGNIFHGPNFCYKILPNQESINLDTVKTSRTTEKTLYYKYEMFFNNVLYRKVYDIRENYLFNGKYLYIEYYGDDNEFHLMETSSSNMYNDIYGFYDTYPYEFENYYYDMGSVSVSGYSSPEAFAHNKLYYVKYSIDIDNPFTFTYNTYILEYIECEYDDYIQLKPHMEFQSTKVMFETIETGAFYNKGRAACLYDGQIIIYNLQDNSKKIVGEKGTISEFGLDKNLSVFKFKILNNITQEIEDGYLDDDFNIVVGQYHNIDKDVGEIFSISEIRKTKRVHTSHNYESDFYTTSDNNVYYSQCCECGYTKTEIIEDAVIATPETIDTLIKEITNGIIILENGSYNNIRIDCQNGIENLRIIGVENVRLQDIEFYGLENNYGSIKNIIIKNIVFSGDGILAPFVNIDGIIIEDCIFNGEGGISFFEKEVYNIEIKNCIFNLDNKSNKSSIIIDFVNNLNINNCNFKNSPVSAIQCNESVYGNIVINNNIFAKTNNRVIDLFGIDKSSGIALIIEENSFNFPTISSDEGNYIRTNLLSSIIISGNNEWIIESNNPDTYYFYGVQIEGDL